MNLIDFQLIRLTNEHEFKYFDCNDKDLNDFFLNDSKDFLNSLIAVTYIIESDKDTVAFLVYLTIEFLPKILKVIENGDYLGRKPFLHPKDLEAIRQ